MKKWISILLICLSVLGLCGCQSGNIEYRAFLTHDGEDFREFMIIIYEKDTHKLLEMRDETHFSKNYGYTWYDVSNIDVNSVYAGFSELPFGETEMKDESDYISFIVRFKELDQYFREAIQIGLLSSDADPDTIAFFDAESLCNSIQARELSKEECKEYSIKL